MGPIRGPFACVIRPFHCAVCLRKCPQKEANPNSSLADWNGPFHGTSCPRISSANASPKNINYCQSIEVGGKRDKSGTRLSPLGTTERPVLLPPPHPNCHHHQLRPSSSCPSSRLTPSSFCASRLLPHHFIPSPFPFQSNAYSPFGPQNAASTRLVFLRAECCTQAVSASTLCPPPTMAAAAVRTTIGHQWLRVVAGISCRRRHRRLHRLCLRCTI